jgi:hypothetical protein
MQRKRWALLWHEHDPSQLCTGTLASEAGRCVEERCSYMLNHPAMPSLSCVCHVSVMWWYVKPQMDIFKHSISVDVLLCCRFLWPQLGCCHLRRR